MPLDIGAGMGVAKLKWRATGDSQEMISTIGFASDGATSATEIASQIAGAWQTNWLSASLSNAWAFTGCDVAIGPPGAAIVGEDNRNVQGTGSFAPLPTNCALLITKITDQAGKGGRGRMFVPAGYLSEGEVDVNGFLSGAALAAYQASTTAFFEAIDGVDLTAVDGWLLFHNTDAANAGGSLADPITALSVQPQIATQRQRMRR